jgi:outer membrane protein assembly factor BamB
MRTAFRIALACALMGGPSWAADWPQFRGGEALGHADAARVPLEWGEGKNLAWRTPIPGAGWSQPVVVGDRIYLTTAVAPSGGRPSGMTGGVMSLSTWGMGSPPAEPIDWRVVCLDRTTGQAVWMKSIVQARPKFGKHASNTYATETPCASADGVYAFFGATGTVVALDPTGRERWRRELGPQPIQNQFGTGSSPLLVSDVQGNGRLLIQLFNEDAGSLVCLDAATGLDVWRAEGPKGTSWSTPIAWMNDGGLEVITAGQGMVVAFDPATGAERWRFGGIDTSFACSVVADRDGVYFGTSSPGSRAPAFALARGCRGDVTLPKGQTKSDAVRWSTTKCGVGMPSPVVVGDHLYFFDKIAVCFDKRTGEERYRKRLPTGSTAVGSPLVVGDRIYLVNERGKTVVVQAGPEFKVLAESALGTSDEIFWATPAAADDALFIRSSDALYCIRAGR